MKKYIGWIFLVSICNLGFGQSLGRKEALQEFQKIAETYQQSPWLSFDVSYYYHDELNPSLLRDSLSGSFKVNGPNYWYLLDNTELLYGKDYVIALYKKDKMMYLSRPSAALKAANPLAMLDSFLLKNDNLGFSMLHENGFKKLVIDFRGEGAYKQVEYDIDTSTGLITNMINVVRQDQLTSTDDQNLRIARNTYGIIEMHFNHYAKNSFDQNTFDTNRYFKKEGKQYVTVSPYADYKIFLGSAGL